jgi:hypothetical protein
MTIILAFSTRRREKQRQQRLMKKLDPKPTDKEREILKCFGGLFNWHTGSMPLLVDRMIVLTSWPKKWLMKLLLILSSNNLPFPSGNC